MSSEAVTATAFLVQQVSCPVVSAPMGIQMLAHGSNPFLTFGLATFLGHPPPGRADGHLLAGPGLGMYWR